MYQIYGVNGCDALLSSDRFKVRELFVDGSRLSKLKAKINTSHHRRIDSATVLDKKSFLNKFPSKHTQGIVAQFEGNVELDAEDVFERLGGRKRACLVLLDGVTDPQNLGQIIRTCECAGVDGVVVSRHKSAGITSAVLQVSQGAFVSMPIYIAGNLSQFIRKLKKNDFWIIGLENSVEARPWHEVDYSCNAAVVMGSEGSGMSRLVGESCDIVATIPMGGSVNSLNVSATVPVILFERLRQIST